MKNLYIKIDSIDTLKKAVSAAVLSPWNFRFANHSIFESGEYTLKKLYQDSKNFYHGNSKLLLKLFYNDIIGRFEMTITTATIEKSYPQIKSVYPKNFVSINYDLVVTILGDPKGGSKNAIFKN